MLNTTINMNGNSAEELILEIREACIAINEAEKALSDITIHGRNYQLSENAAEGLEEDLKEKRKMIFQLGEMYEYLTKCYRKTK